MPAGYRRSFKKLFIYAIVIRDRFARSGKNVHIAVVLFILCLPIGGLIYQKRSAPGIQTYRQSRLLLDTVVELILVSPDETRAKEAMSAAYAEMQRVEALLSKYRQESQIFRINQQAGQQPVVVDNEVIEILRRSLAYSRQTEGLFDISIAPLVDLWGVGTEHERVPDAVELEQLLTYVNYAHINIRKAGEVFLRYPQNALDLGGIAKGYSIDRAFEVLKQHGITSALVNAGGDIRCIGRKTDGSAWRIGVKHPREKGVLAVIELKEMAVATSGDYERFFLRQNTRFHHLLDPRSGLPARDCQSVTILAPSTEQADVMATAVFIMGPEQGLEFIETHADIEGMIVDA
ncbi:MAG: FAD:protein FMN transferase, partial [bacterium]|nr:FAD:protein FMN transferase [bacterium]